MRSAPAPPRSVSTGREPTDVLDKIDEEVAEVRREVESGATGHLSKAEEEMGDLLFAIANLSRKLGIEPEAALRRANEKFTTRFDAVEQAFAGRGETLSEATLEEMEAEWQRVKIGRGRLRLVTSARTTHTTITRLTRSLSRPRRARHYKTIRTQAGLRQLDAHGLL